MKLLLLTFCLVLSLSVAQAYTIVGYDPINFIATGAAPTTANVAALNTAVGLTTATIEDFEDDILIAGLSLLFDGSKTLPSQRTYGGAAKNFFDGSQNFSNDISSYDMVFSYAPGTNMFAIGIGDVESLIALQVNGVTILSDIRNIPNRSRVADDSREVYLRIDRQVGDAAITEVRFLKSGVGDGIFWDHLAVSSVPEPGTYVLCLLSLLGFGFKRLMGR